MKSTIGGIIECGRDAKTGLFIPKKAAKKRKATAVVEAIRVVRRKDGRFAKQDGRQSGKRPRRTRSSRKTSRG